MAAGARQEQAARRSLPVLGTDQSKPARAMVAGGERARHGRCGHLFAADRQRDALRDAAHQGGEPAARVAAKRRTAADVLSRWPVPPEPPDAGRWRQGRRSRAFHHGRNLEHPGLPARIAYHAARRAADSPPAGPQRHAGRSDPRDCARQSEPGMHTSGPARAFLAAEDCRVCARAEPGGHLPAIAGDPHPGMQPCSEQRHHRFSAAAVAPRDLCGGRGACPRRRRLERRQSVAGGRCARPEDRGRPPDGTAAGAVPGSHTPVSRCPDLGPQPEAHGRDRATTARGRAHPGAVHARRERGARVHARRRALRAHVELRGRRGGRRLRHAAHRHRGTRATGCAPGAQAERRH